METDVERIICIARNAEKVFGEEGLNAAIHELDGIRTLVAGGELSWVYGVIDLLCDDLEKHKGQNVIHDIETFIEIVCSRVK